jgi:hypothetical protein
MSPTRMQCSECCLLFDVIERQRQRHVALVRSLWEPIPRPLISVSRGQSFITTNRRLSGLPKIFTVTVPLVEITEEHAIDWDKETTLDGIILAWSQAQNFFNILSSGKTLSQLQRDWGQGVMINYHSPEQMRVRTSYYSIAQIYPILSYHYTVTHPITKALVLPSTAGQFVCRPSREGSMSWSRTDAAGRRVRHVGNNEGLPSPQLGFSALTLLSCLRIVYAPGSRIFRRGTSISY